MSKQAILALVTRVLIASKNPRTGWTTICQQNGKPRTAKEPSLRTLRSDSVVDGVALDERRLANALAVGLENVDGLDGVARLTLGADRLDSIDRVHNHGTEKVVVTKDRSGRSSINLS